MDRLSPLDAEFLHVEDGIAHMHIAGLSVFEGPPPAVAELEAATRAKLHLIPRYRQRARSVPLELGRPVWLDDPDFDLGNHLRHVTLPAPADDAALTRTMAELMSEPLDRERPLWETTLVEGLSDERWALIFKIHHAMVDGVSGVALLAALLDTERETVPPDPEPWQPEPEPSGAARVVDAWAGLVGDAGSLARRLPEMAVHPVDSARALTETGLGLMRFGRRLSATEPLSIEGSIGPDRAWAHSSVSLADVKAVGRTFGGTVNDVVLGAVSGGYRELLVSRGDDPDTAVVRTLVPVSVRDDSGKDALDNRVSGLLCELPVHLTDPVERLVSVQEQMAELKASHMAEAGEAVLDLTTLAPPMILETGSHLAVRLMHQLPQRSVNTVTTNVPGPQLPLYCLGREMLEYRPYVPISHGVRVGTAILSYNGRVAFGVTGDKETASDVGVLATAIADGVDELGQRAGAVAS